MNSPNRPASPSSTASSESPPPEEVALTPVTPKRPLSGSATGGASKSRRKVDHAHSTRRTFLYEGSAKDSIGGRREEFVDVSATDRLKKMIGDPFDDAPLLSLA